MSGVRTCPNCNEQNREDAQFCRGCGAPLGAAPQAGQIAPPQSPLPGQHSASPVIPPPPPGQAVPPQNPPPGAAQAPPAQAAPYYAPPTENAWPGAGTPPVQPPQAPPNTGWAQAAPAYAAPNYAPSPAGAAPPPAKKKKFPKAVVIIAVALVLVLLAVFLLFYFEVLSFGGSASPKLWYEKDGEMYYAELTSPEPVQLTDGLYADGYDDSDYFMPSISGDGSRMLYTGENTDYDFSLFYQRLGGEDSIEIDSEVTDYYVNDAFDRVFYLRDDELYTHDFKDREQIEQDVYYFALVKNSNDLVYVIEDDNDDYVYDLYYKPFGKDAVQIDEEADKYWIGRAAGQISYLKGDVLYTCALAADAERERLASGVTANDYVYHMDDGSLYFTKTEEDEATLGDYLIDDMDWGVDMDEIVSVNRMSLHYFDGKETTEISGRFHSFSGINSENDVITYMETPERPEKVRFSELDDEDTYESSEDFIARMNSEQGVLCVATSGAAYGVELENVSSCAITDDAKTIYVLADYDDDAGGDAGYGAGTVYSMPLTADGPGGPERYESDVTYLFLRGNNTVVCDKNIRYEGDIYTPLGDIYLNGEEAVTDVNPWNYDFSEDGKSMYYLTDEDPDTGRGTLWRYKDGESEEIAEDVYDFSPLGNDSVAYLYDYDIEHEQGDLYLQTGSGEAQRVDRDVSEILYVV